MDKEEKIKKIEKIIEDVINPKLLLHQGWIEFVVLEETELVVKFRGACASCAATSETIDTIILPAIQEEFKEITKITIDEGVHPELLDMARKILGDK